MRAEGDSIIASAPKTSVGSAGAWLKRRAQEGEGRRDQSCEKKGMWVRECGCEDVRSMRIRSCGFACAQAVHHLMEKNQNVGDLASRIVSHLVTSGTCSAMTRMVELGHAFFATGCLSRSGLSTLPGVASRPQGFFALPAYPSHHIIPKTSLTISEHTGKKSKAFTFIQYIKRPPLFHLNDSIRESVIKFIYKYM